MRATIRRSQRTGGDPVEQIRRRRSVRPRRLVMLADISGSMEPYARAYLQLLHCAAGGANAETFVFAHATDPAHPSTTHPQPERRPATGRGQRPRLGRRDPSRRCPEGLQRRVGTARSGPWCGAVDRVRRMGLWGPCRGRRADGPTVPTGSQRRMGQPAQAERPAIEPLVGGMAAALPHVDAFVSGHSLEAMYEVLRGNRAIRFCHHAMLVIGRDFGPEVRCRDALLAALISPSRWRPWQKKTGRYWVGSRSPLR